MPAWRISARTGEACCALDEERLSEFAAGAKKMPGEAVGSARLWGRASTKTLSYEPGFACSFSLCRGTHRPC